MDKNKAKKVKKILNIFVNVILYAFLAVCLFALVVSITSKKDAAGAAGIFGKKLYVVVSPSMEKCADTDVSGFKIKSIPVGSMVFVDPAPDSEKDGKQKVDEWYSELKVGDVLTFITDEYGSQLTITHRIIEISELPSGGYRIELRGDNTGVNGDGTQKENGKTKPLTQVINDTSDENSFDYVLGKVTGQSRLLGWIAYSMQKPAGIILIIIIPCAIIIMLQFVRIIGALGEDKKQKAAEKEQKTRSELEELKKQLAELQQARGAPPDDNKTAAAEGEDYDKTS